MYNTSSLENSTDAATLLANMPNLTNYDVLLNFFDTDETEVLLSQTQLVQEENRGLAYADSVPKGKLTMGVFVWGKVPFL